MTTQNGKTDETARIRQQLFEVQNKLRDSLTEQRVPPISPKTFRTKVDSIENPDHKYIDQFYYLVAARLSEATSKTYDADFLAGASRPYGNFMKMQIVNYEWQRSNDPKDVEIIKTWLITLAVAKRGLKMTEKKREKVAGMATPLVTDREIEQALIAYNRLELLSKWKKNEVKIDPLLIAVLLGRVKTKTVALPLSIEHEPWTFEMLRYLQKRYDGKIPESVPFTLSRQQLRFIIRESLGDILPPISVNNAKNILRHWRISHLVDYYHLTPAEVTLYTGWTPQTAFAQQGAMGGSSNLDEYYHGQWKTYFPKMLRPIASIA